MIWRRIWFLLHRSRIERELSEEMADHRERMGAPQGFGNQARLLEDSADVWGWRWLDEIVQDTRHGLRVLRRSPSFALTAIAILSLGIGLNLAFFQLLNAAMLRPLEVREPATLIRLFQNSRNSSSSAVSFPVTQYVKGNNSVFSAVLTDHSVRCAWGNDAASQVDAVFVSSNYFDELGAGAVAGRVLHEGEDDRANAARVVVISYEFWQSRLGADPRVVGSLVRLNGKLAEVAGVGPAGFYGPRTRRADVWAPIEQIEHFYPGSPLKSDWGHSNVDMYARLRPGVSEATARESLRAPMAELGRLHPKELNDEPYLATASGERHFRRDREDVEIATIVALVTGLCLLVLVVACSNLASLTVANVSARARECQIRASLGASRARVLRQLVTESAILVASGSVAGWFVGYAAAKYIVAQTDAPFDIALTPDWRMTLGAVALGWIALLVVGLLPAWRVASNRRIVAHRTPRTGLQRTLIGVQVMGSCVLLLVGGVMVRKLQSVIHANLGFEIQNVAVLEVALSRYGMAPEAASAYWRDLREAAAADPRMEGAALSTLAPMGNSLATSDYRDAPGLWVTTMTVDSAFLPLLRIRLLAGRNFQSGDTRANAVIISRRLAERMYGSGDVLGKSFPKSGEGPKATIIGLAADANLIRIAATNMAEAYWPLEPVSMTHAVLLARVNGSSLDPLRTTAWKVNAAITPSVHWMRSDLEQRLLGPRLSSVVASAVGLLALALTSIGIYGLVAYTVSLRAKEIGIRFALGAGARGVMWLVVRDLAWPIGVGVAAGAAIFRFGLAGVLSGEPLFVDPRDLTGSAFSLALLLAAGLAASLAPASRAFRIHPASVLRDE